jgi:hypothetical protein
VKPDTILPRVIEAVAEGCGLYGGEPGQADAMTRLVQEAASTLTVRDAMDSTAEGCERLSRCLTRASTAVLILAVYYAIRSEDLKEGKLK